MAGGATRADSVRCGLAAVPDDAEVIVVHDAARPLASPRLFDAVLAAVGADGVDGAVPGVPPSDTIKAVDGAGNVTSTLDRSHAGRRADAPGVPGRRPAPGPRAGRAPRPPTTPCSSRRSAARVRVVPGEPANLKITGPDDLGAAERLLASGEG